ncbi:MAG: Gfo/Idh/MocA family oxidoreductase [Verrucomicrobiaceae bacterium]|jgi:myo-inositol 2-dehydrogenase / D-chiro-inositol 1-dehydrogenase|nr:Gfo/Idh/MocA family oxidoreductase [Verrucomicrobiaceae bacterium]
MEPSQSPSNASRRQFIKKTATASAGFTIVPSHVVSGQGKVPPPSETLGGALIGAGGRGPGTFKRLGDNVQMLAKCDVKYVGQEDNKTVYSDFRRLLERKDIDVVAIATPPHWHALISMAAAAAGKDVVCEKPMTRFIAEGRAVVETFKRYNRIFQIGTFGRFGVSRKKGSILRHKIMSSGLLDPCPVVYHHKGGLKVKQWSGRADLTPTEPPENLNWDLYVGPSPMKSYVRQRTGGTHRNYWDYEGGGLADMAQHSLDPFQWTYAKDHTSPVEIEAHAPPAHPELCAMWGWIEMKYADGLTLVMESDEWGDPYTRRKARGLSLQDLSQEDQAKIAAMPDPEPLVSFPEAVKTRQQAGGHAEAAHRCATLLHLANISIRTGRKIKYDPIKEEIIGDEQANRLVNPPMRAPWHLPF